jgi:hypothetical protein
LTKTSRTRWGAWLLTLSPFVWFIPQLIAESAWTHPHYNPLLNWISDNGVPVVTKFGTHLINSPLHIVMNIGFVGHALFFFAAYWLLRPLWLKGRWAHIMPYLYTIGVLFVGFFPGYDWALRPLHPLGATTFLIVGDILAIRFGRMHLRANRRLLGYLEIILGIIGLVAIPVMFAFYTSGFEGLIERFSIYPVLLFDLVQGLHFLRESRKA